MYLNYFNNHLVKVQINTVSSLLSEMFKMQIKTYIYHIIIILKKAKSYNYYVNFIILLKNYF